MIAVAGALARPRAPFARLNPATKLIVAAVLALGLIVAVDPVTSGLVLAVELCVLPLSGVRAATLARLCGPLLLGAVSIGVVNAWTGQDGVVGGIGLAVRLLAIALPGVLAAATTDPTDLADALVQRLHLPERPAIAALAALRLLPVLAERWRTLTLARRARGLEAGRNPVTALAVFAGKMFALLVATVRAGTLLAIAMDARGFGTGPRTHARTSELHLADVAAVVAAVILVAGANATSAALGTWHILFG